MMILAKSLIAGGGLIAVAAVSIADAGGQLTISSICIGFTGIALVWFGSTILRMRDDLASVRGVLSDPDTGLSHRMKTVEDCYDVLVKDVDKIKYGRRKDDKADD